MVAVRLENPALNSDWFQVSDMRDTFNPHPVLTLVLGSSSAPPTANGDSYTVAQGVTLTTTAPQVAPPTPLVSYNFDEAATGTTPAQDGGPPPSLPGTFTGAATRTPSTPGFASTGALDLTAPGRNTVNVGPVAALNNASALTVTAWINLRTSSSNTGKQLVNDHNLGLTNANGWDLELYPPNSTPASGDTRLQFTAWGASGTGQGAVSNAFLTTGKWVFVAATFSPGRVVTFYAGDTAVPVSQVGQSGALSYGVAPSSTAPLIIGDPGWSSSNPTFFSAPAWLDDVRVFGSALTAAQVEAIRQSNLPASVLANDITPARK